MGRAAEPSDSEGCGGTARSWGKKIGSRERAAARSGGTRLGRGYGQHLGGRRGRMKKLPQDRVKRAERTGSGRPVPSLLWCIGRLFSNADVLRGVPERVQQGDALREK